MCSPRLHRFGLTAVVLTLISSLLGSAPASASTAHDLGAAKLSRLALDHASMENALRALRDAYPDRFAIGFECAAGVPARQISLQAADRTIREVLDDLVAQDPSYRYTIVDDKIINIFPADAARRGPDVLGVRVGAFRYRGRELAASLIARAQTSVPEVQSFLHAKRREAGQSPEEGGGAGSTLSGDVEPPMLRVDFEGGTFRELLNEMSRASFEQGRLLHWGPTSWKYTFVVDAEPQAGIGGRPTIEVF